MAKLVETFLVDDLTGERAEDGTTITFGIDGKQYEIDLSQANAQKFRDALAEYVAHARTAGGTGVRRTSKASSGSSDKERNQAIREWARERGIKVSDRGRIAADVIAAYEGNPGPVYPALSEENAEKVGEQPRHLASVPADQDTDEKVVAWMQAKGFKVPASGKPNAPMKARYRKEVLGA